MNAHSIASAADLRALEQLPYAHFMAHTSVLAALEHSAARHGERLALTALDSIAPGAALRRWSHAQYVADVRRAAHLFARLAGSAAPRVALLLPPSPEAHFALWGAEAVGVACPINHQLNPEHVAELVRAAGANIVVALGPCAELDIWSRVAGLLATCPTLCHVLAVGGAPGALDFRAEMERESGAALPALPSAASSAAPAGLQGGAARVAALFHTGGTTGAPKLAQHTQANQLHAAWGAAQMYRATEHDVILNGFPLFHVAGSFVYGLSILLAGGEVVLPPLRGLRDPEFMASYGEVVQRHRVTLLATVPTLIAALLALPLQREQLASVRALLTGGSPLPDELAAAFEQRHGIAVRNILGMTECAGVIAIEPLAGRRTPGSCGLALPYTEVQAQRADGSQAPPGESGILRVRGPNVGPGYTDAARNPGTFENGWLVTGDIGHVDAQGRVFVTGRAKDVIIRGAHNIDPGMIESALLKHPDVQMAAAVGEPDEYAGELPVAFILLKPGARADAAALAEIAAFAAPHIAERPAVPKRIDPIDAMPLTAIGKVYKPALRLRATQRALQERIAKAGLAGAVRILVEESSGGLTVRFSLTEAGADAAVRELMKPFALAYSVSVDSERSLKTPQ
jgi:fatty-acyl-CoA synthase